jgi:hypothetical protein
MDAPPTADRLRRAFALYPTTQDEDATCQAILDQEPSSGMLLMPTHHISPQGDMMGFRYECAATQPGNVLPVVRNMFFGHTAVECLDDDAAVMKLISDPEANRRTMADFLAKVAADRRPAELDCIPDNASVLTAAGTMQGTDLRSVDCKPWSPEAPESIGLYHAYIRGYNRDVRTHKLFIVCSGGCPKAADQFCNLMIDVGHKWTAGEVADSEEAWWLKKASHRARCRLICMLAEAYGVRVQAVEDVLAHPLGPRSGRDPAPSVLIAVPTTDTIEHDMARRGAGTVAIFNAAVDTTRVTNGILCQMHPSEGYWLFRGAPRGTGVHGAMFGAHDACGAFPTRSPCIAGKHASAVTVHDGACVVRAPPSARRPARYVCFDEAFFKNLERMQWNRDNGYVELIPVVVGIQGEGGA